nr:PREDICTED: succinate receptor 1 [Apteryx mantelli mantelli]
MVKQVPIRGQQPTLRMAVNETGDCLLMGSFLEKYYLSTMYSLEFILGLTGNTIVVFGYIFCLKNWKSGNIYLFNLSLSDFLFLCTLPLLVKSYSSQWAEGVFCQSNRFLEHFLQKRKTAVIVSVAIWIWVVLELLPLMHFLRAATNERKCLDYASSGDPAESIIYSMFLTLFGFLIPLCVMCFFYVRMVVFLKNRSEQHSSFLTLEKPLSLVILAVVIFSLLFTPYHIMRNVRLASQIPALNVSVCTQNIISAVYIITRPIAFLNSAINPVFYFLMGDHFREMLMAKIRQLLNRKRTNKENSDAGRQGTEKETSLG